jgi:hypothetical protein
MFRRLAKYKCAHCPLRFTSRRVRVIHEATECPKRPRNSK